MPEIIVIAHNLRSCHNVGSLLRTAEGLGVKQVILSGYTPYPANKDDERLPHIATKLTKQISKTALGAETSQPWEHYDSVEAVFAALREQDYTIAAIEQSPHSVKLPDFQPPEKIALLLGREVDGVEPEVLAACDTILEIPMFGKKESFNVIQAAAMAMYHCTFTPFKA
jgi:tRNA G18 (ribose-2'-O)-methylase SpoU